MPIYEYQCADCGQRIERLQGVNDPPPAACEACGGSMARMVSAPAFQFKGSGWYVTDYGGRKSSDDDGGSSSSSAEKADKGSSEASSKKTGGGKAGDEGAVAKKASATSSAKAGDSGD
jgi:putative FmdB family regulatory protein